MTNKPDMILFLSDARGIYIPKDFATGIKRQYVSGVSEEDWSVLEAGPDHEWYWETWDSVLNNATVTDDAGIKYRVEQDGDCWLIPEGMEWSDEEGCYQWPVEETEEA